MARLIDIDALVAEIKGYKDSFCDRNGYLEDSETNGLAYDTLCELEDSINALEVKEVDLEKDVRQIISLYYEGIKYYEDVIRKEREENGGSDLAIKIMDGVVDARELSIQYVIDKLKAQKRE